MSVCNCVSPSTDAGWGEVPGARRGYGSVMEAAGWWIRGLRDSGVAVVLRGLQLRNTKWAQPSWFGGGPRGAPHVGSTGCGGPTRDIRCPESRDLSFPSPFKRGCSEFPVSPGKVAGGEVGGASGGDTVSDASRLGRAHSSAPSRAPHQDRPLGGRPNPRAELSCSFLGAHTEAAFSQAGQAGPD